MANCIDIAEWVKNEVGCDEPVDEATSLQELGVYGDDWDELMTAYAERFRVDMSEYLWYFHTREEGQSIGGLVFRPPNRGVHQIRVRIAMLREFAGSGKWSIDYPQHRLPNRRYDLLINATIVGLFVLVVVLWAFEGST